MISPSHRLSRLLGLYLIVLCAIAYLLYLKPPQLLLATLTGTASLDQKTFSSLLESNLISEATITYRSDSPLRNISGRYFKTGDDGKKLTEDGKPVEVPFHVLVADLSDEARNRIAHGNFIIRENSRLQGELLSLVPVILIGASLWYFFIRQIKLAGKGALSFGKNRAKLITRDGNKITFADVASIEEAMEAVSEVVDFLKDPKRFQRLGGRIPKGILLVGPPGTGKTLLAKAIAGEADAAFFSISGSDFVEMFVGVGASRVRDLFEMARRNTPCLIFIDEIDAVGRSRSHASGGANDEREQTLNALLVQLDGFDTQEGIIIIAATNRLDMLDPALLRPGRFDRKVVVSAPDTKGRLKILSLYSKKCRTDDKVDLEVLARSTTGFTGADLEAMFNEAALIAARANKKAIQTVDLEEARNKVSRGIRQRNNFERPEDKWRAALHEIAHLSASLRFPSMHSIDYVSLHLPFKPDWFKSTGELSADRLQGVVGLETAQNTLCVLLAGRAAEQFFLGEASNLGESDTAIASALAHHMLTRWGMSESVGLVNNSLLTRGTEDTLGGYEYFFGTPSAVHRETKKVLALAHERALEHVKGNRQQIVDWASRLYETEALGSSWVETVRATVNFKGKTILKERTNASGKASTEEDESEISKAASSERNSSAESSAPNTRNAKLSILKRNRDILELQITSLGVICPPHILTQLQDTKVEIAKLETSTQDNSESQ